MEQGDLPGLVSDDILRSQVRGHSAPSCNDQRFLASLEDSLTSTTLNPYPILTVCSPSGLEAVAVGEPELTSESGSSDPVAAPGVGTPHGAQYILHSGAPSERSPDTRPSQSREAAGQSSDKMEQTAASEEVANRNSRTVGNACSSNMAGDKTPPNSPSQASNSFSFQSQTASSEKKKNVSGFSRNISNPALREKTRTKLEDVFSRVEMFRSVAVPYPNALCNESVGETEPHRAKDDGKQTEPPTHSSNSKPQPGSSNKIQSDAGPATATAVRQSNPEQAQTKDPPGDDRAAGSQGTRQPVRSSITLARAFVPSTSQINQMYGLPGLGSNPLPPTSIFSNRLNPFEDSDEVDTEEEPVHRACEQGTSPSEAQEHSAPLFSSIQARGLPERAAPAAPARADAKTLSSKTKSWWRRPQVTPGTGQQPVPARRSQEKREAANKRSLFGQSVTLGVMRKLGMGKSAPSPTDRQPGGWSDPGTDIEQTNVLPQVRGGPEIVTKTNQAPKSAVRVVNGVRVTGSSLRSGTVGSNHQAAVSPRQQQQQQQQLVECLECSCSLYHSHHFPGQPVNRDVLVRVERREDAIMTSLRLEEAAVQNKDQVRF